METPILIDDWMVWKKIEFTMSGCLEMIGRKLKTELFMIGWGANEIAGFSNKKMVISAAKV